MSATRHHLARSLPATMLLIACLAHAQPAPEGESGFQPRPAAVGERFIAVTAHPAATDAAAGILRAGGTAVDAAIAAQMVLTLVEPQSSGIGGGAFLLHFDGQKVDAFDGRETAPTAASSDLFLQADGRPMAFGEAMVGGRSVGTPGVLRMLELAHRRHGRLPWPDLFAPAIALAERGFPVSHRLHTLLANEQHLQNDPQARAYFYDAEGKPWPVAYTLQNPALADTLRRIASQGADAFYTGKLAADIVHKVREHNSNPGLLSTSDLEHYRARERTAVCTPYRRWTICGMPPPSSGGIAVAQILGLLEGRDMAAQSPQQGVASAEAIHLFSEAGRLAFADRARYVADTDFVPLPGKHGDSPAALLAPAYLKQRATLIGTRSMGKAEAGQPLPATPPAGNERAPERPSTTHLSIVDGEGHAVAMTSSIENAFGSRLMVNGFLLNNQLTDFSFVASDAQGPIANRVEGGKRPRSSMAPTLIFDREQGDLLGVVGSPGGSQIINYVARTLLAILDWQMDLPAALALPHFGSRNGPTELEQRGDQPSVALQEALKNRGHALRLQPMTSGISAIMRIDTATGKRWAGAADPRREGSARGD
ncbi:MAG: gamma-glutamyltransferase [Zoogloeaceae bacterium]|nr:gamma-glutamyltransferase [Zoogloeaceae bacterium]